ncbi:putative chromosome segregation ATPase-like protein [Lyngbya aestuarii BL J]|uniref:Putative chromosome segregation ATPase-like protein n=1 Tax=Lyngbya aestuarii BL J TaxID=1348334 RepID=U7QAL5_9CYAN|nr:hypothetical protein [Lyngbya aestuarii]ERT04237.1 putative chromosome segregation ATPase-like protein [Lyngbya aestuarii BL J]
MQNLKLEDLKTELDQTKEELERSQLQLNQLLIELEQSQTQLYQMQREMEEMKSQNVKAEADETKEESSRSQVQLCQLLMELEQSHTELFQTHRELEESESFRKQIKVEFEQTKSNLEQTYRELVETKSAFLQTQGELDRYKFGEAIASQIISERERQYHQFVWDAWYAYRNGDINQMVDCLQKSLKYTSFSRTKTVSHWLKSWSYFSLQKGEKFEVRNLNSLLEWKQLLRRMTVVKSRATKK